MAKKSDAGKPRYDLLPVAPLREVVDVLTFGAVKYSNYNYLDGAGLEHSRLYSAAQRHLQAYWGGEGLDKETDRHHLAHACSTLLMLMDLIFREKGLDDRNLP